MPKARHKKRKFIDPKNERTTTFKLIHRSQKDPLAADDEAPQRVLIPITSSSSSSAGNELIDKRKEEERKWGVFYDDDYNYMQHLKDRKDDVPDFSEMDKFLLQKSSDVPTKSQKPPSSNRSNGIKLPDSVFGSNLEEEEEVGLLNKAAPRSGPRLDWDPEIVAALDDDFDFDDPNNELEDDFMNFANASGDEDEEEFDSEEGTDIDSHFGGRSSDEEDEEDDEVGSLDGGKFAFAEEETASRFTSYSMSSSVIRRNKGLSDLDDRFEKFFEEYDDQNVGALDCDEIEGNKPESSDVMRQVMTEYEKKKASERVKPDFEKTMALAKIMEDEEINSNGEDEDPAELVKVTVEDKWDCESILSTYSNIYNHPKLISERKLNPDKIYISGKTGMPKDVLGKGLTVGALKRLDAENENETRRMNHETATLASRVSELSFRSKHETKEEKKARKDGMKEYKKQRRIEKKANREAFQDEKNRQEKILMNNAKNALGRKIL